MVLQLIQFLPLRSSVDKKRRPTFFVDLFPVGDDGFEPPTLCL